jgi:hypothetical protein
MSFTVLCPYNPNEQYHRLSHYRSKIRIKYLDYKGDIPYNLSVVAVALPQSLPSKFSAPPI